MTEEKLNFQAEVSRLLDIVAHSLYSNKEIFLRELVSNASDACDRLRYAALTQPDILAGDSEFNIRLSCDKKARKLCISDNGIGMNRGDLIENLGTIARSGTANFVEQLSEKPDGANLIGQFGVGFYSAFMVAGQVEVTSRKAGEAEAWRWTSDGKGEFTIAQIDEAVDGGPARGTQITLHLKKGQEEFLDPARLRRIIQTYSDHIAIPVVLEKPATDAGAEEAKDGEETLNSAMAIWTRQKSDITDEQYKEFYHHVSHAFDDPWLRLHFRAEGRIEYTGLLFVPTATPFNLFHPDRKHGVKLYVKRVFITDDCAELVPTYLRFLSGIVDTEDLPLNISREMLQHNPMLAKIREAVAKRVLSEIKKKAKKSPDDYATFWRNFGSVLKEGLYEAEGHRETLLELARFPTTGGTDQVSLADYADRMVEGQEAIYYISGDDADTLRKSPQLEGFAAKGIEVLFMTDPVDEFWIPAVVNHQGKPFKSVTRGGADLSKIKSAETNADEADEKSDAGEETEGMAALIAFIKLALKDSIKDVRASERLTESAVCLVADEGDMDMHLERLLKQHNQLDQNFQRILEINPKHSLIRRLAAQVGQDGAGSELEEVAWLLLDQARIMEGEVLPDPAGFSQRLAKLVEKGLG